MRYFFCCRPLRNKRLVTMSITVVKSKLVANINVIAEVQNMEPACCPCLERLILCSSLFLSKVISVTVKVNDTLMSLGSIAASF